MSDEYFFRIPQPFHPFENALPTPLTPPDDSASQVCIMVSRNWLPYIRGALKVFQYDDIWETPTETLKNDGQMLLRIFSTSFECGFEGVTMDLRAVDLGNGCQQFQWRAGLGAWMDLGTPVCNGADGADGADGEDGANGAPGEPGEPGDDCDCQTVPPQPEIGGGDDRCQLVCNISMGVGAWMHGFFNDALLQVKAGIEAGDILADLVGDLIDAFPIIGAVVDAIQDFAVNVLQAGADELLAANGEYFKEMIQCKLFCIMADDTDDITVDYIGQVMNELRAWAVGLPPQTALLVVIGQAFAAFAATIPNNEVLRRANIYDENNAECDLCDCECTNPTQCYEWDFVSAGDGGFTRWDISIIAGLQLIGVHTPGVGWEDTYNSARGIRGIGIQKTFGDIDISKVEIEYSSFLGGDTDPLNTPISMRVRGFETANTVRWSSQEAIFGGAVMLTYEPATAESIMKLELLSHCAISDSSNPQDNGGTCTITKIRVYSPAEIPENHFTGGNYCP